MINQWIVKILQLPKLFIGFVVILMVLIGLYLQDPPKTLCDIQMEAIEAQLMKGFYSKTKEGLFGRSVKSAKSFCLSSNSPGGCYDLFTRLSYFEKQVKTLPTQCGPHPSANKMRSILQKSIKLFVDIGWGDQAPKDKYNKTSWLDPGDLGLYCRLKYQHQRLYGKQVWQEFAWAALSTLPGVEALQKKQIWERSLFSYSCQGVF